MIFCMIYQSANKCPDRKTSNLVSTITYKCCYFWNRKLLLLFVDWYMTTATRIL